MGETSGTAIRALALGKPLVVSDVGWFAELPDDVALKVPVDDDEVDTLVAALDLLASRPDVRAAMGAAALELARTRARPRPRRRSLRRGVRARRRRWRRLRRRAARRQPRRPPRSGSSPAPTRRASSRRASARSSSVVERLRAVPAWATARRHRRPLVRRPGLARPRDARPVHHGRRADLLGDGEELRLRPAASRSEAFRRAATAPSTRS